MNSAFAEFLSSPAEEGLARAALEPVGFTDWRAAHRSLERLAAPPEHRPAVIQFLPHLLTALAEAADPDRVLAGLERLSGRFARPADLFNLLAANPRAVEILVAIGAGSQFLTEILLRNPHYLERLIETRQMAKPKSTEQFYSEAKHAAAGLDLLADQMDALRRYQSYELLRIGACDILDLYDVPAVTRQLSNLADALIRRCLKLVARQSGVPENEMVVLGMGKLGGRELNYSSDIDLLFITQGDSADFQRVGERLISALSKATGEGFLYRVDMRLRPWGRVGPLVNTVVGSLNYLERNALQWEKQALLKARVIAGNPETGASFLAQAQAMIFGGSFEELREGVFAMKQRTEEQLRQSGRIWGEVKRGAGSIRDVEFTVQLLQLAYGGNLPEIRSGNTLDGLVRLAAAGLITVEEHRQLTEGYVFLRTIEHFLQMMHYRQTHTLPDDPAAQAQLARRLGFLSQEAGPQFLERYQQHCDAIRAIYLKYVGRSEMHDPLPPELPENLETHRHVDRMAPSYAERFTPPEVARHAVLATRLTNANPVELDLQALDDSAWRVSVVAFDYPGEFSLICGLFFVHGLNIISGDAFTYEPAQTSAQKDSRRKIVDVFIVQPVNDDALEESLWARYTADLAGYLNRLRAGERREVQGDLLKRVANVLHEGTHFPAGDFVPTLYPIEIQIDNDLSDRHTVLQIEAPDTFGFLYELSNALALNRVYIDRVTIDSTGSRVHDTLFVSDENGRKIVEADRQRQLRAATVLIKHFTHLLPFSPNPESALLHFRDFIDQLFHRANWLDELASLERPEVLQGLARLLGVSDFLWDDFLRMQYANLFPVVKDIDALESARTHEQLQADVQDLLRELHAGPQSPDQGAPWIAALNDWRDREMLRVDMRHILGHTTEFWDFAAELADLAEVVVNNTFHLCHEDLRLIYGTPQVQDGGPCHMSVVALGKFGGREMGFASDVELMFIYAGNGITTGPRVITSAEFYEKLVENFVSATRARREGIFEVDLQLRPYGKAGSLAVPLDSFRRYFAPGGPAWAYERQALVKMRPVAGDQALGQTVCDLRDAFVYTGEPFDVTSMRAMRERQLRHLVRGGTFNLKYSLGGLVDIEYLLQGLQITHGAAHPEVRLTNTREALAALAQVGILSEDDYARLRKAHTFLRWSIDSLRVVRGNAKDVTVPMDDSEGMAYLARRMRYGSDVARLQSELERYTEDVREINARLLV